MRLKEIPDRPHAAEKCGKSHFVWVFCPVPESCHYIPLNDRGDTVASLQAQGDRDKMEAALLTWLHGTVARLEKEVARAR